MKQFKQLFVLMIAVLMASFTACGNRNNPGPNPSLQTPSPSPAEPTATQAAMAFVVNGEGIPQVQYQAELQRYQDAHGTELASSDKEAIRSDLIAQLLLAQGAREAGHQVTEQDVQQHLDELTAAIGGSQKLTEWMDKNHYDRDSLKADLMRNMAAAWMRTDIITKVPTSTEQVHVRQIILYDEQTAKDVLNQLKSGMEFIKLATKYDPVTYGDLGWFPRGFLLDKNLEQAAFDLQPEETSDIVQTAAGYHILFLIERDPNHPLDPDTLKAVQAQALQTWLVEKRQASKIEIITP